MWLRRITTIGVSTGVVLPPKMLRELNWKRGDMVNVQYIGDNKIVLAKIELAKIPDSILKLTRELPVIKYA